MSDNEITPLNFSIYRRDRCSRGGGVAIILSNEIPSRLILVHQSVELISIEILLNPKLILVCVYIPPSCSIVYMNAVLSAISSLPDDCDIIIAGDFNCPDINWSSLTGVTSNSVSLCNTLYSKNLIQLVTTPTHKQGNILDIVLTNLPDRIINLSTDPDRCSSMSDHLLLSFSILSDRLGPPKVHQTKLPRLFNYSMADYFAINNVVADFEFSQIASINVDIAWADLRTVLVDACNEFIPTFKSSKGKSPRWYTAEIRHNINRIRSLRRRINKNTTPGRLVKLTNLSAHIHYLMETAKTEYQSKLVSTFGSNPRKLYSYLSDLHNAKSPPNIIHHNNSIVDNPLEIAEIFNKYFNSTFTSSNFTLPDIQQLSSPISQLSTIHLDETDIYEALATLDPTKSSGCDDISPRLLKNCASALTSPVARICSLSLQSKVFPSAWKLHKICPIPKKGDLRIVNNYRPISLLPILSKVLESIVYKKIISFMRPLLAKCQYGFLKNRSCLSQMLVFFSDIFKNVELQQPTDIVYLDFRKAFDSVPHEELLFKLWRLGITGPLWLWFRSYLSNRSHSTCILNHFSSYLPVYSGVPQGSVRGPLLFLVYINDLPDSILSADPFFFADDTKLVKCIESSLNQQLLQIDLDSLSSWCDTWNLGLNKEKCAVLRVSTRSCQPPPDYQIQNSTLTSTSKQRDLGILIALTFPGRTITTLLPAKLTAP